MTSLLVVNRSVVNRSVGMWRCIAVLAGFVAASSAHAAIYSCVDGSGRRLTSDRPIVECATREQRMLNTDGSVRQIVPPTMTPDERAEADAKERQAAADRVAQQDAMRRDRNLVDLVSQVGERELRLLIELALAFLFPVLAALLFILGQFVLGLVVAAERVLLGVLRLDLVPPGFLERVERVAVADVEEYLPPV